MEARVRMRHFGLKLRKMAMVRSNVNAQRGSESGCGSGLNSLGFGLALWDAMHHYLT